MKQIKEEMHTSREKVVNHKNSHNKNLHRFTGKLIICNINY